MEYFTVLMDLKECSGKIKPIITNENSKMHLIYADDVLIFAKADASSVQDIKKIFGKLKNLTGLQMNN